MLIHAQLPIYEKKKKIGDTLKTCTEKFDQNIDFDVFFFLQLEIVYKEHIHIDEEIRLCTEGSGFFDVRDLDDKWIRIELVVGDLIILPAGIYHHFALDKNVRSYGIASIVSFSIA